MPLTPGMPVSSAIHELVHHGSRPRSHKQIVAIAEAVHNRRADGGGIVRRDGGGGIGGIAPPQMNQSPFMQSMTKQYAAMPEEKLQEMALRFGNSPQGQVAQRLLMQKRMMPQAQPATPITPQMQAGIAPSPDQPLQSAGAGIARGGPVRRDMGGGLSLGEMNPWWTRAAAREDEDYGGGRGLTVASLPALRIADIGYETGPGDKPLPRTIHGEGPPRPPHAPSWMEPWEQDPSQGAQQFGAMAKNLAGAFPSSGNSYVGTPITALTDNIDPSSLSLDLTALPPLSIAKGGAVHETGGDDGHGANGFLHSPTAGRADQVRTTSPAGGYIIPADVVSGLGEGNSLSGADILNRVFPYTAARGATLGKARGGGVPTLLSGGEYAIHPRDVERIGGGNMKHGHAMLDRFVVEKRRAIVGKMKALKGPVGAKK